ncbi:osmoprotectant transport system substrate-binding protein [Jatrophihabitans endophyticus]|uniref:Osmoprotectant transport system substrate-binding protein n=1 Tax=Jatrophihabitans endophyticus TaxID=1206085 RepID=A0A1M5CFR4_9ACTN|nr:glycine betaine ABC transporter substrate-binding protein [Jatrophihabitans endophyticus]SHF53568.1 osmoprotectant transport system substrate-binding protein [Jatrophihabitans endophyticus]
MRRKKIFGPFGAVVTASVLALGLAACGSDSGSGSSESGGSTGSSAPSSSAAPSPAGATGTGSAELPTGTPGKGKPAVIMGDKDFAEQFLLGELYAQALRARGYTINLKENIGSSEIIDKALTSGQIQMYPEYTGVIFSNKALADKGDHPKSATVTYQGAKQFEESRGYTLLNPTPFQDADGVAVTKSFAQKNGLKTIDDLSKLKSFTYAGPKENRNRYQGVLGLKQAYKLNNFTFSALPTGNQYSALDRGNVNSIAIFTTDAALASGKYTVLTDTKGIFGYQQVAPVVKQSVLKQQGPEFEQTLNAVSKLLTTDVIIALNKEVQINQKKPADIARIFLKANKLL